MRRLRVLAASFAVCASLLAAGASASNPPPFHFNPAFRWLLSCNDLQSPITGACVTNPASCAWNDEDDVADTGYGKLTAGQTVSDSLCVVTDTCNDGACPHYIDYKVTGPANLTVRLTDDRGGSWSAPPVRQSGGGGYVYQLCFPDPYYNLGDFSFFDYPLVPSPGYTAPNDGARGYVTVYTLSIFSPKSTNQGSAGFEVAQNGADGRYGYWHVFDVPCEWSP